MHPILPERAKRGAFADGRNGGEGRRRGDGKAGLTARDIDAVICAASNHERAYPPSPSRCSRRSASRVCLRHERRLLVGDLRAAARQRHDPRRHRARRVIVDPDITSGHQEWRDRDCHFIFGDVCTAIVVRRAEDVAEGLGYEIVSTRCLTEFSNAIRNNNGFLRRTREGPHGRPARHAVRAGGTQGVQAGGADRLGPDPRASRGEGIAPPTCRGSGCTRPTRA